MPLAVSNKEMVGAKAGTLPRPDRNFRDCLAIVIPLISPKPLNDSTHNDSPFTKSTPVATLITYNKLKIATNIFVCEFHLSLPHYRSITVIRGFTNQ